MDWKNIASKVSDAAPLLGGLLGGPAGATVGGWIAKAFGTATGSPDQVLDAMNKDAEWSFKLKELETNKELEIEKLQQQVVMQELVDQLETIKSVNATMQVESASEKWWVSGWRPFIGFVFGGAFAYFTGFVCYLMYLGIINKDAGALAAVPQLIGTATTLFGIPGAILGVTAWGRNKLKVEQLKSDNTKETQ